MGRARKLPTAPPATVLRAFLQVLLRPREGIEYSVDKLHELGISGPKRAHALLTFLGVLTDGDCLEDRILQAGRDSKQLRKILREQLLTACSGLSCTREQLSELGGKDLPPDELTSLLNALPPIRGERNDTTRSNMIRCTRTLHFAILHLEDRNRLEDELRGHDQKNRKRRASRSLPKQKQSSPSRSARTHVLAADGGSSSAQNRSAAIAGSGERAAGAGLSYDIEQENTVHDAGRFPVAHTEDNRPIYAYVHADRPLTGNLLERLANQLLDRAKDTP